jgi:hypothetical protein
MLAYLEWRKKTNISLRRLPFIMYCYILRFHAWMSAQIFCKYCQILKSKKLSEKFQFVEGAVHVHANACFSLQV